MNDQTIDVVVIGAGPVGENVAQYAHEGGLSVLLVDEELFGGECSYYACMPSKALLRPVDVAHTTRHLQGVSDGSLDSQEMMARRDYWVNNYDDGSQVTWARDTGLEVARGRARIIGEKLVEITPVGEEKSDTDSHASTPYTVHARVAVVLATGSTPVIPPMYEDLQAWGSRDATGVVEIPSRLIIVGGGVVAMEAAAWMQAMGSQVTMLVRGPSLLEASEPFAGKFVQKSLEDQGIDVVTNVEVRSVKRDPSSNPNTEIGRIHGGTVHVDVDIADASNGSVAKTFDADELLLATGRRPAVDNVGLQSVGLTPEDVRAGNLPDWLHAIGDAGPGASLTHQGKYEARMLGAKLSGMQQTPAIGPVPVPQVVFTDPQVASVGLTEKQAVEQGHEVATSEVELSSVAGVGLLRDDVEGKAKLVVDAQTGVVLGATFVGPDVAELLHPATVAIVGELPVRVLRHAVPAYPTSSEVWLRLLEKFPVNLR
ncbi:dihydrolipoyl dehydrogenase family protein [Arcanobacterium pinnipediorum]|uniref:NAD(P)/FAD-dependent oxidoreductase n=1 Tax=Arcanobacterium pinnipediorum TaxID=1503041 RepID=A0ABY5AJA5_9ACTO|nr:NAD(P)/FAD-dependent oxidoreductase [Arcanobacterium pinnipediorum]USR79841.1 NAD(P)/FAD-dependent oxidoreductase [Arcanobacterium pinnipediorum]